MLDRSEKQSIATRLARYATGHRLSAMGLKTINPPISRATTLLFDSFEHAQDWWALGVETGRTGYGITGTDLTHSLEDLFAELDGGTEAVVTATGLSAVALALSTCLAAGDHLLMADNVYGPARTYAERFLVRFGVEVTFFDPLDLKALAALIGKTTKVIYFEVPGSLTFEVPDCAAIYALARQHDLISIVDTTWPTSLYYPAVARGADISVAAGTKYYAGHCDCFFGVVVGNDSTGLALRREAVLTGNHLAAEEAYMALRGMRTLKLRLDTMSQSALTVANHLAEHPKVAEVRHPALPTCPGHENWVEQFTGSGSLFGLFLHCAYDRAAAAKFVNALELFGIGYSWGGFESLALVQDPLPFRAVPSAQRLFDNRGALIRLQIGLEDPQDLIQDLDKALEVLA